MELNIIKSEEKDLVKEHNSSFKNKNPNFQNQKTLNVDYLFFSNFYLNLTEDYDSPYEIYKLNTQKNLNLSICNNTLIDIYSPVNLDPTTESFYNSLNNSGYNLFDANDSFYNDICTPYTTENGTDIIIEDRQNTIYISD